MRELLVRATEIAITLIDALALFIIVVATLIAFVTTLRVTFKQFTDAERRAVWLRYARWLVAGLTFQLAADIVESSVASDWTSVGRLAAIAAIRTFLNYFLERDVVEVTAQQAEAREVSSTRP